MRLRLRWCVLLVLVGCAQPPRSTGPIDERPSADEPAPPAAAGPAPRRFTVAVVGTSDLHGRVEWLPLFGGFLANLRAAPAVDRVVLLDAGDMFQGTLESNLGEGDVVIAAYNALGYDAAAIGNHEFDYGPAGDPIVPAGPDDDPRGALRARAAEARFPLLAANLREPPGGPLSLPNVTPSVLLPLVSRSEAGTPPVVIGVIGVTTESTLTATMTANVADLTLVPLAQAIAAEAEALRRRGAAIVLVAAHAGGRCHRFDDPDAAAEACEPNHEIMRVAEALGPGVVDAIVAGHTHSGVAHRVSGIPIIQAYAYGRAFARVDLVVEVEGRAGAASMRIVETRIQPPRELCPEQPQATPSDCQPGSYEGQPVTPDAGVAAVIAPAQERAAALRAQPLEVEVVEPIRRSYGEESALGNLFTDLMLAARPKADVALTNGGGLRADLPPGPLTYGALYQAAPFDNRFATVRMTAGDLGRLLADNLQRSSGIMSIAGVRARARCEGGELRVTLLRNGKALPRSRRLTVVTSDFLAAGGDGAFARLALPPDAIVREDGPPIRDAMAEVLRRKRPRLSAGALLDPRRPRLDFPGKRPVRCEGEAAAPPSD